MIKLRRNESSLIYKSIAIDWLTVKDAELLDNSCHSAATSMGNGSINVALGDLMPCESGYE